MTSAADLWEWVRTPLDELKHDFADVPDKPWEERRAEFLEHLGLTDSTQHPMIQELFVKLDEMSDVDRAHAVESGDVETIVHELTAQHGAAPEQTATDGSGYDEQAWETYLSENGPAWDGTEQSWEQYTQWFLYYAEERGVNAPATALIDYLTTQPAAQRISTFAEYGVTITQATQLPDTGAEASADIDTMMADVLAEDPSLAAIPEGRRREILAEVLGQK